MWRELENLKTATLRSNSIRTGTYIDLDVWIMRRITTNYERMAKTVVIFSCSLDAQPMLWRPWSFDAWCASICYSKFLEVCFGQVGPHVNFHRTFETRTTLHYMALVRCERDLIPMGGTTSLNKWQYLWHLCKPQTHQDFDVNYSNGSIKEQTNGVSFRVWWRIERRPYRLGKISFSWGKRNPSFPQCLGVWLRCIALRR